MKDNDRLHVSTEDVLKAFEYDNEDVKALMDEQIIERSFFDN
jgi:hypothetical protein